MQSADVKQRTEDLAQVGAGHVAGDDPALRARQDILFAETPGGVLVKWGNSGFVLKGKTAYRWLSNILPRLDGQHTMSDLVEGLDEARAGSVRQVVSSLVARGVVQPGPSASGTGSSGLDEQLAFIGHFVPDAAAGLAAVRSASVQVHGSGPAAAACVAALVANGFDTVGCAPSLLAGPQVCAEADRARQHGRTLQLGEVDGTPDGDQLAVDLDLAASPGDVLQRATEHRAAGRTALPVVSCGEHALVGPLWEESADTTPEEAWERYLAACPAPVSTLFRRRWLRHETRTSLPGSELSHSLLGNLVAFEMFKHVSGIGAESEGRLIVFDLETTVGVAEKIVRLPQRLLADDDEPGPDVAAPSGDAPQADRTAEGAWRDPLSTDWADLVGRYTGLIPDFDDLDIVQSPLKIGRLLLASPWATEGTVPVTGWSRSTIGEARDHAARRAMARYAEDVAAALVPPTVSATDLGSGTDQTLDRELVLHGGAGVLAAATAAGGTLDEALGTALDDTLAAMALRAVCDRTSTTAARVRLDTEDTDLRLLSDIAAAAGITLGAVAHEHPGGRVSVVATATRPGTAERDPVDEIAAATCPRPLDSAASALTEVLARAQLLDAGQDMPAATGPSPALSAEALAWVDPSLQPLPGQEVGDADTVHALSQAGIRCLRVALTPEDVADHAQMRVTRLVLLEAPDPA